MGDTGAGGKVVPEEQGLGPWARVLAIIAIKAWTAMTRGRGVSYDLKNRFELPGWHYARHSLALEGKLP